MRERVWEGGWGGGWRKHGEEDEGGEEGGEEDEEEDIETEKGKREGWWQHPHALTHQVYTFPSLVSIMEN